MSPPTLDPEKEERRLKLYNQGLTDREIGEKVGVVRKTIGNWRRTRDLPAHPREGYSPLNQDQEAERRELHEKGLNDREIAERIGVDPSTICQWRDRRGLPSNYTPMNKRTPEEVERVKTLNKAGLNDVEIAEEINRSVSLIRLIRNDLGLPVRLRRGRTYSHSLTQQEMKVINLYHKHREWDWTDLAEAADITDTLGEPNTKRVQLIIGKHLMRVCRSQQNCPLSPLLPENTPKNKP